MSKELVMQFLTELGTKNSIKVKYVKEGLSKVEIQNAMDGIISSNAFLTKSGVLVKKYGAKVVDTITQDFSFVE